MISTRDFNGADFHAYCQQQYDDARRFLKGCGKPKDDIDRFLIDKNKADASIFGKMLDSSDAVKLIQLKKQVKRERELLQTRLRMVDEFLGKVAA